MDALVHVANLLYLASYSVRDILWLRVLTVVATTSLIPYFYFRAEPLLAPIYWNTLFIAVNGGQIYMLILQRRPVRLSEDERWLHHTVFRMLRPREFLRLANLGQWKAAKDQAELVRCGQDLDNIMVVLDGKAEIRVDGQTVAEIGPGQFIGEMSYLTGDSPSADVVVRGDLRYLEWPQANFRKHLADRPQLRAAVQSVLSGDLVGKLRPQAPQPTT